MKKIVNVQRAPNVEPRGKSTTPNPNAVNIIMKFKKKKNTIKTGGKNNFKNAQMNFVNIIMNEIDIGEPKTPSTLPSGTVLM